MSIFTIIIIYYDLFKHFIETVLYILQHCYYLG